MNATPHPSIAALAHDTAVPRQTDLPETGAAPVDPAPELPETRLTRGFDRAVAGIGRAVSLLWIPVMLLICYTVLRKNVFGQGSIWLEELQWQIASGIWLIGLVFCLVRDAHVRVDFLYEHFSRRGKAWTDLLGHLFLGIPFFALLSWYAWQSFATSWNADERSSSPDGLDNFWILKGLLALSLTLLAMAALVRVARCMLALTGRSAEKDA